MIALVQSQFTSILVQQFGPSFENRDPLVPVLIVPCIFGRALPVGDDAFHKQAVFAARKRLEKFFRAGQPRGLGNGKQVGHGATSVPGAVSHNGKKPATGGGAD